DRGTIPSMLDNPLVGRSPKRLLAADGIRIEPQVSDPQPIAAKLAAIPAAVPPLEPPGIRVGSYGLQVWPASEPTVVMPLASSCRFVLPRMIAPASRNFLI